MGIAVIFIIITIFNFNGFSLLLLKEREGRREKASTMHSKLMGLTAWS